MRFLMGLIFVGMLGISSPLDLVSQEPRDIRQDTPIRIFSEQQRWHPRPLLARFEAVRGDSLVYKTALDIHPHAMHLQAISKLEVQRSSFRNRLLGLGIGALAGGLLGAAVGNMSETKSCWGGSCSTNPSDPLAEGLGTSLGVLLGGITGYLAGGSIPNWQEVRLR